MKRREDSLVVLTALWRSSLARSLDISCSCMNLASAWKSSTWLPDAHDPAVDKLLAEATETPWLTASALSCQVDFAMILITIDQFQTRKCAGLSLACKFLDFPEVRFYLAEKFQVGQIHCQQGHWHCMCVIPTVWCLCAGRVLTPCVSFKFQSQRST